VDVLFFFVPKDKGKPTKNYDKVDVRSTRIKSSVNKTKAESKNQTSEKSE